MLKVLKSHEIPSLPIVTISITINVFSAKPYRLYNINSIYDSLIERNYKFIMNHHYSIRNN